MASSACERATWPRSPFSARCSGAARTRTTPSFDDARGLLVIAAGCTEPGGVCFCASMGTGPAPGPGFDLALTERIDDDGHRFVVEVGTEEGARVLDWLTNRAATQAEINDAKDAVTPPREPHGTAHCQTATCGLLRTTTASPPSGRTSPTAA